MLNSLMSNWPALGSTINVAGELLTVVPPFVADARISVIPADRAVTFAVADPLDDVALVESTVATAVLFDAKEIVMPLKFLPN